MDVCGGWSIFALCLLINIESVWSGVGCFVCYSKDGSDPQCEDPFHTSQLQLSHNQSSTYYQSPCWGYRKDRNGYFPADHCIKISGKTQNSEQMTVRTCAVDSGTLTADTEIVRISHCGQFDYDNTVYEGCVQSCSTDGCNTATNTPTVSYCTLAITIIMSLLCYRTMTSCS